MRERYVLGAVGLVLLTGATVLLSSRPSRRDPREADGAGAGSGRGVPPGLAISSREGSDSRHSVDASLRDLVSGLIVASNLSDPAPLQRRIADLARLAGSSPLVVTQGLLAQAKELAV